MGYVFALLEDAIQENDGRVAKGLCISFQSETGTDKTRVDGPRGHLCGWPPVSRPFSTLTRKLEVPIVSILALTDRTGTAICSSLDAQHPR